MRVRFLGGGHSSPLQSSCLENPMDRGAWGYSPWGRKESDTTERQTLSLRIKLAGSKFGSLETREGGEELRTRKQRVKFAKFRAVEPQRVQRNGNGFRLTLEADAAERGSVSWGVSVVCRQHYPSCAFLIPILKFCSIE